MKKHLLFISLIIIFSAATAVAGMRMRGSVESTKPDGEVLKVEFFGGMISSPDGVMSHGLTRGRGQFLPEGPDNLMELRTVSELSKITEKFVKLDYNGKIKTFLITPKTKLCDLSANKIQVENFNEGLIVTVVSDVNEKVALSVRKGPIFFSGVVLQAPEFANADCIG
jgi:hypothetical protein